MNLTVPGHKEDELIRLIALDLAKKTKKTVAVTCGIHIDEISMEDIVLVSETTWDLVKDYLDTYLTLYSDGEIPKYLTKNLL